MRIPIRLPLLAATLVAAAMAAGTARAESDGATASVIPWSGTWWAHNKGGLTRPLRKYDQCFGTQAEAWEQRVHVEANNVQDWFGHCHAWSAASVTEEEPSQDRTYKNVNFDVGDQKGLLTALHAQDQANTWGDRMGDGQGSEESQDIRPDELLRVLQLQIKQNKVPVIFDLEPGSEVWNYPCYDYEVEYQDAGNGYVQGTIQIAYAEDNVEADYQGTYTAAKLYYFQAKMQGGSMVAGSSQWINGSENDHPDFAWYPYVAVQENTDVTPDNVSKIVGYAVGGGNSPPSDDPENPDDPADLPDTPPTDDSEPIGAEPVDYSRILTPIEIVSLVANKTSHFGLDIFVDRNDGGKYAVGEAIRIAAESDKAGFIYLFDIGPNQELSLVFPLAGEDNRIAADTLVDIPAQNVAPWFTAENPGEHHLRGVVTTAPLALSGFATQSSYKAKGKDKPKTQPKDKVPAVQKLHVPPTTAQQMKQRLKGYYGTKNLEYKPPVKCKEFAQDDCLFYVINTKDKN
ncbi:MAG: DUF4384 domain-containing protein [Planctomycetales bacterium]|nr:DUF4384 domain-containing protein [Planctomycetales bacterium]